MAIHPEVSSHDWEARDRRERLRTTRILTVGAFASFVLSQFCMLVPTAHPKPWYVYALVGTPLGTLITWLGIIWLPRAGSEGFVSFLWPNKGEAVRETSYSHIQAMAAAGDVAGALAAYEAEIAANPAAIAPRAQAAELYATGADPARAAKLFAEIRRIPGCSTQHDLYATQRLVDLYDGALGQPQKSLTELRRIVERHAASREAPFAREALARRKREIGR
ncbi:MAG: hypothetical protein HOQ11_14320 [Gemmatimonadaceae bacterium]|nr:hypothetical protein [Gemmatimonadaceae bacterium]NUQ91356.1 hypothetical protein [Gemmatimonadaceae bacterium]NUR18062.1 hypothetical protein [Gemmatimonadaceae bacterium]NUS98577.1 hypothetical protein [Gemmatimonadaceae bacterium]